MPTLKPVEILVTAEMVRQFAALSGDHSSLHLDAVFARRSLYRENVAHGFLPLLFLAALDWQSVSPRPVQLKRLAASFLKPVYAGDKLVLTPTWLEAKESEVELEFEIHHGGHETAVTTGSALLIFAQENFAQEKTATASDGPRAGKLLSQELTEQHLEFEQINKGDQTALAFSVTADARTALREILRAGTEWNGTEDFSLDATHLLASTLFSTVVGMCLPGKRATFLNFEISFAQPIPQNRKCALTSQVAFKSPTTSTISQTISIQDAANQTPLASGKIHVRVNPPPSVMPSLAALRETAVDLQLRGKVVLITGGSRGIGETTAKLFALHGAKVAINYLQNRTEAERIVREIGAAGHEVICLPADVANRAAVNAMVRTVRERFGTVDILVNNAVRDAQPVPFLELSWSRLEADLNVVLQGAFNCCQEVLPLMVQQQSGKIINLATVFVEFPPAQQTKYVVAKSALVGLTRSLAVEFARHNIQANLVVPSMVETDLSQQVPKIFSEKMKSETPMQRLASPVDVAKAIVFLASSLSSFTTGQKIMVTGGGSPML